ncbi:MAG: hypothetical protein ACYTEZ_06390 [Planctomycetota bacterium]|jgi:hypothetical protein
MKRTACLCLVLALALAGCSSSGDGIPVDLDLLALAQCTGLTLSDANVIVLGILDLLGSIPGPPLPPGTTYDAGTGDYSVDLDFDDDGTPDATVSGVISSPDDISDGIDPGEKANSTWNLTSGPVMGGGVFDFDRLSATALQMTGNGSFSAQQSCDFDMPSADITFPLNDPTGMGPTGSLSYTVTAPAGSISGAISFDGSSVATVNATYAGGSVTFRIDLDTFLPIF